MASLIYNRYIQGLGSSEYDLDGTPTLNVGVMLVTATYTPNVDTHLNRSNVTNEVVGSGYSTKIDLTASVSMDTANDRLVITLPGTTWTTATITARAAVYFLDTGVAANDLLIAYNDFGSNISSTAATFTLNSSTITIQNNSAV
jgi:hypothetical protein